MKVRYIINLSKGLTFLVVLSLMFLYDVFTTTAWIYLALHGTYGILWILKDIIYPDKQWDQVVTWWQALFAFGFLSLYWVAPYLLISRNVEVPPYLLAFAVAINLIGVFLHFVSDAQKYYTLKYSKGLINEGLFAKSRNPNYLGELFIYLSFAILANHWLPYLIIAGVVAGFWLPNMKKKENSLSRYETFEEYRKQSGLLIPKLTQLLQLRGGTTS